MKLTKNTLLVSLRGHLKNNIFKNISWLFLDKFIRLCTGLLISVLIARYLGPANYGKWNYATALIALLSTFGTLGLESLVIRDIINDPKDLRKILGSSFVLRFFGGIVITVLSCLIELILDYKDTQLLIIVFITSISYIFLATDVIDFYFQSMVKSKFTVFAKLTAFILCSIFRGIALFYKMSLIVFVFLGLVESIIGACLMIFFYIKNTGNNPFSWLVDRSYLFRKIKEAWPLILSGVVVMVYMRIDQIMLKQLSSEDAVGTYSVAVNLSETWYLIPMIISSSIYPGLLKLKQNDPAKYLKCFQLYYKIFFALSVFIGILTMLFSSVIVKTLYGSAYKDSASILDINIWAGVFVFLGVISTNYMVIEGLNKISFYKTFFGAIFNVLLNFILIPRYNGVGAAIATLISYAIAAYFSNILFKETRGLFRNITYAILNFWRISDYKL